MKHYSSDKKGIIMAKQLVAYFSASGTTARTAKALADAIGADLFEIAANQPYTSADLNWNNKRSRSSVEMNDDSCRPAIANTIANLDDYDTIYVGFPIWWYVEPRIIDTFLEAHDLSGKKVVVWATSGGSGLGRAPQRMQQLAPGAKVVAGGTLNGRKSTASLRAWAEGLA